MTGNKKILLFSFIVLATLSIQKNVNGSAQKRSNYKKTNEDLRNNLYYQEIYPDYKEERREKFDKHRDSKQKQKNESR